VRSTTSSRFQAVEPVFFSEITLPLYGLKPSSAQSGGAPATRSTAACAESAWRGFRQERIGLMAVRAALLRAFQAARWRPAAGLTSARLPMSPAKAADVSGFSRSGEARRFSRYARATSASSWVSWTAITYSIAARAPEIVPGLGPFSLGDYSPRRRSKHESARSPTLPGSVAQIAAKAAAAI
jgi:hypothetical protein